jgi:hypothetical protein
MESHPQHPKRTLMSIPSHFTFLCLLSALAASGPVYAGEQNVRFHFENIADTRSGFTAICDFPAINNSGEVAFVGTLAGVGQGVFRSHHGRFRTIASELDHLKSFDSRVAINSHGLVAYAADVVGSPTLAVEIRTGDGEHPATVIVNSRDAGFFAFNFGAPALNDEGRVAFAALLSRSGPAAIFTGDGGALHQEVITSDEGFLSIGLPGLNNRGEIVFSGQKADRSGLFAGAEGHVDVVDSTNSVFQIFDGGVINRSGVVAGVGGNSSLNAVVITVSADGVTQRTDPNKIRFFVMQPPSLNNLGAVAFSAQTAADDERQSLFVELTGGNQVVPVLQIGDRLFGSIVTDVKIGQFAFNDRSQIAFRYTLQDGRSGIAVASLDDAEGDDRDFE